MNLWVRLHLKWKALLTGADLHGNTYYTEKKISRIKKQRRFVLYKGTEDASRITPLWHRWLHYTTDDIPIENTLILTSEMRHLPNLTGTQLANNPTKFHFTSDGKLKKPDYTAWNPTL